MRYETKNRAVDVNAAKIKRLCHFTFLRIIINKAATKKTVVNEFNTAFTSGNMVISKLELLSIFGINKRATTMALIAMDRPTTQGT